VAEVLKQEMQAGDVKVSSTGEVDAFVEGNVGWVSSRPVWFLEDGTEILTRSTAIFHREDGEWKMVQGPHFSRGVKRGAVRRVSPQTNEVCIAPLQHPIHPSVWRSTMYGRTQPGRTQPRSTGLGCNITTSS